MSLTAKQKEIKDLAEADLVTFVKLVAPERVLGHCHVDLLRFFQDDEAHYQLCIWPRGHQKSTMIAYWAVWKIRGEMIEGREKLYSELSAMRKSLEGKSDSA